MTLFCYGKSILKKEKNTLQKCSKYNKVGNLDS
jgi:hypothetical protein